jgi:hypothetical protein
MDVVTESVAELYDNRATVKGLKMVYEPSDLRFFKARFEPVDLRTIRSDGAGGSARLRRRPSSSLRMPSDSLKHPVGRQSIQYGHTVQT